MVKKKRLKNVYPRWTVINISIDVKDDIVKFAEENGLKVSGAITALTKKELKKWKKRKQSSSTSTDE